MRKIKTKAELKGLAQVPHPSFTQTFHAVQASSSFTPVPPMNSKVECAVCKKRFKNETSKNYHEMFHTQEERDEASGGPATKPKSRAEDFSDSESDSELLENRKTKKGASKAKEEVKKVEKEAVKTKPEMVKAEAAKVLKKRFSEASEDSDNACDSNYLSLKHISMSIKKQDERRGAKEVSAAISKPMQKQADVPQPPKAALSKNKPEIEEKPRAPSQKPEPKPVTKQKVKAATSEPLSSKKVKLTCDQCKKKFSEIMALEYHKITFHAEVAPSPPAPAPIRATVPAKSSKPALSKVQKDQRISNAKTKHVKESDESESESESDEGAAPNTPEPEMKRYADEKNKLSALSGIFNKKRFSSSSSEPVKKGRDTMKFKSDKKEAKAKVKPVEKPKKVAPKALKSRTYTESDSESESDHKSSKETAKQKAKPKKPSMDSDSDSDPVDKPAKSGKKKPKAAKLKQPDPELKEDEEEEKEKYKKVPCNMCGRQMANEFVLQYHLVRCPGAKKRPSVDSPAAAAAGDNERKKAKKDLVETEKSKSGAGGKKGGEDVKKIDNTKWWGGDLKDIYTDRRKKKVDYLEVSDIEESDGDDGEEEKKKTKKKDPSIQKKNLNKESRISSTSDEDSDKEENLQKKKSVEKKPQKKEVAVVEKKRQSGSQPKSIAVQIFKGKRKEESSEDEESPTKEKNLESLAKDARKRKSETLPVSEESPLSKSTKKKAPPLAKTTAREKMVTSDSEPEIVKKDMIKIEDDSEEKTASLAEHDLLSNQIREKLLSNKSEKVRCENCNKSLKNSIILQYHMLHCTPTPGQKSEKKTISSSSGGQLPPAAVEKKIIDSKRSTASPVDMILKKLTEKVQSSPSPSSAISSPVSSPGSSYKFFKSKGGDEKSVDPVKKSVEEEDEASKKMKDHIKSCHDKQISVSMKKMSQSEIEKSPTTGKSKSQKSPTKSLESEPVTTSLPTPKKPEKKESSKAASLKSAPSKSNVKSPKSKEEVPKQSAAGKKSGGGRPPVKKTTPAALKKKLAALSSDSDTDAKGKKKRKSYTEDSDSDDDDDSEFEVNKKKRKPTLYCFESCFEEESNEMIGCDFCDMWYHPECLGLTTQQAESLTESDSWMCPECQDKEALKDKSKGKRVTTPASSYKPIPITPMTITAATTKTKEDLGAKKAAKVVNSKKKEEGREEKKSLAPVPPKKNLVLAEKLKKAATATERKSGDSRRKSGESRRSSSSESSDFSSREATPSIIRIPMDVSQLDKSDSDSESD